MQCILLNYILLWECKCSRRYKHQAHLDKSAYFDLDLHWVKKYLLLRISDLAAWCLQQCSNQSYTPLLSQARLFDEPQLASLCLDTIDKSTMDAISAEGFTDIDIGKFLLVS